MPKRKTTSLTAMHCLMSCASLASRYPSDTAVREQLAGAMFNTLIDAKTEDDLARRDTLLDELRKLVSSYPNDTFVRKQLAMAVQHVEQC